jgi:purine-binding chemotaxis protein CheW
MTSENLNCTTQYLTFKLGQEVYALDVVKVREVLDMTPITKVPRSAEFMCGVINVRGSVVPVVDLRKKFDLEEAGRTVDTRIVVMEIELEGEPAVIGAKADSVHEVMEIDPQLIEVPPKIGAQWHNHFIKGIGKTDDGFIMILDIDRVFSHVELALLSDKDRTNAAVELETAA